MPLLRFLPPDDPRIRATVLAIADELTDDGLVLRYSRDETDDGLSGEEGTFTICSFWLVSALVEIGELDRARQLCERLLSYASPLQLYAEEIDPTTGRHLGNFPQAFTHLALINAVMHVIRAEQHHGDGHFSPVPRSAALTGALRAPSANRPVGVTAGGSWVVLAGMQILILGGTAWLGRTIAATAIERGHEVTCLARGEAGGWRRARSWSSADRADPAAYDQVRDQDWDAVVEISWQPGFVRSALAALGDRARHWTYVSSCSVYADQSQPGQDESGRAAAGAGRRRRRRGSSTARPRSPASRPAGRSSATGCWSPAPG